MFTFTKRVKIEGHDYKRNTTIKELPLVVKNHWYFRHLVEIGDIIDATPKVEDSKPKRKG